MCTEWAAVRTWASLSRSGAPCGDLSPEVAYNTLLLGVRDGASARPPTIAAMTAQRARQPGRLMVEPPAAPAVGLGRGGRLRAGCGVSSRRNSHARSAPAAPAATTTLPPTGRGPWPLAAHALLLACGALLLARPRPARALGPEGVPPGLAAPRVAATRARPPYADLAYDAR